MIPAIILAAGRSSRMGRPKALLPVDDGRHTFVSRILFTLQAAGADDLIVVVGHGAAEVKRSLADLEPPPRVLENPQPDRGQLSSLHTGLLAVDRPGVTAALVTLVDVPLVAVETVRLVLEAFRRSPGAAIVRPAVGSRHGHPVLFNRDLFAELLTADPAGSAKAIVRAHADATINVQVEDEGACLDIDTREDYERLIGAFPRPS